LSCSDWELLHLDVEQRFLLRFVFHVAETPIKSLRSKGWKIAGVWSATGGKRTDEDEIDA
jgi:hypothetical protein